MRNSHISLIAAMLIIALAVPAVAQTTGDGSPPPPSPVATNGVPTPAAYVIGVEDVLAVFYWREQNLSAEVVVRPDGMISLPLVNDIQAAGLTPEQLRLKIADAASTYVQNPTVSVVVKQINSRKVFVLGNVAKPGEYPLLAPTTVVQLLAMAGGLQEFANAEDIAILRTVNGRVQTFSFNYKDVSQHKRLEQNILLMPGDTVMVR